ncbi:hypothetical protein F0562_033293 [Nyssa sinensis]|uniref:non-specific serine/threonine protein kinase n=1 Tax=Nyssa sinensis TaxID=561372 RepID=A0A5J5ASE4_9ASTE|nr:hypothetical protein F0562_033293 [Nyssa sinensis]
MKNVWPLRWEVRYNIVMGTVEGLAYLHEDSELRIIHRDVKLSNILLDQDFTPTIADFGLARLFPEHKTHISTAITSTLGYMAPEYVVRGKLMEKVDIYSFGVLEIEVVCVERTMLSVRIHSPFYKWFGTYMGQEDYVKQLIQCWRPTELPFLNSSTSEISPFGQHGTYNYQPESSGLHVLKEMTFQIDLFE